jgi:putative endonuclease
MYSRHVIGKRGEDFVCNFLEKKGYTILDRNFHSRVGEIDVIALEGRTIVFVEVKTRTGTTFGSGLEAIGKKKMNGLIKTAYLYLAKMNKKNVPFRFDACEVTEENGRLVVNHIENITF